LTCAFGLFPVFRANLIGMFRKSGGDGSGAGGSLQRNVTISWGRLVGGRLIAVKCDY